MKMMENLIKLLNMNEYSFIQLIRREIRKGLNIVILSQPYINHERKGNALQFIIIDV